MGSRLKTAGNIWDGNEYRKWEGAGKPADMVIVWKEYEEYEKYVYRKIIPIFVLGKMGMVAALYRVFID